MYEQAKDRQIDTLKNIAEVEAVIEYICDDESTRMINTITEMNMFKKKRA